jgi:hypothetical protein
MADRLKCGTHGEREARFVCDHLFRNGREATPQVMVYFEPAHEPHEPTPAIWCQACEDVILERGAIDDVAQDFAEFRAVCDFCFQKYLDANVPASAA